VSGQGVDWQEIREKAFVVSHLFTPLQLRDLTIKNRIWVSPMCQYSATDGVVGDWHLMHLGSFATGGAGLVIAEASGVVPEGRISVSCPGLWNEEQVVAWRRVTGFIKAQGSLSAVQLAHAGRKAGTVSPWSDHLMATPEEGGWQAVGPSALAYDGYPVPRELTTDEIRQLVRDFSAAAVNAVKAGFDAVEIHAAHGYLLNSFMSPLSNNRTDEYGGSFENRIRFMLEVARAVRRSIPSTMPLMVRISASEWVDGGWTIEDSIALCEELKDCGVDLIDVSSGGNSASQQIVIKPGYQVHFAEAIREATGMVTSTVGLITEAHQAEEILVAGKADVVMVARGFLRNPHWANEAAEQLGEITQWPNQYVRARTLYKK